MKPTLGKVQSGYFWFGMKIDVKVFITYCCNIENGSFLIDRYFMFRAHFMKKVNCLKVVIIPSKEVFIILNCIYFYSFSVALSAFILLQNIFLAVVNGDD